jgi:hypothetical protein
MKYRHSITEGTICYLFTLCYAVISRCVCPMQGQTLGINPLAMMISAAFASSYAYVLPVSTPPNAIAYAYGRFTLVDMVPIL